ncbi:uncharacterized protein LAESUDRAFT_722504 [Laetiporus sulphureus 93-53]|uniref:Uncharacterized protein n=1 Tax=Laetiporus sulphureus 93-53 TaxID=1314785 RepID=A0A165FXD9_9APHY|nr:uncharacterized protein LAESUDRAFT_722504 [Laetiporus sulphureus 93-53]KZT09541.1 hypothetical protein LAESUDRAFT_722504 [Laetiporus sulphureus 93-53]
MCAAVAVDLRAQRPYTSRQYGISHNVKANFTNTFGERNGKLMMQATAGGYVYVPIAVSTARVSGHGLG